MEDPLCRESDQRQLWGLGRSVVDALEAHKLAGAFKRRLENGPAPAGRRYRPLYFVGVCRGCNGLEEQARQILGRNRW